LTPLSFFVSARKKESGVKPTAVQSENYPNKPKRRYIAALQIEKESWLAFAF